MTVRGFIRWLRTLRGLNALRDGMDDHSTHISGLTARLDGDDARNQRIAARLDALETQSTILQQALDVRARELHSLTETLAEERARIAADASSTAARLAALAADLAAAARETEQDRAHARAVRDGVRAEITALVGRLSTMEQRADAAEAAAVKKDARIDSLQRRLAAVAPEFPSVGELTGDDSAAWFHAAVEASFRGPFDEVRRRLDVYVRHLDHIPADARALPALDLGCGRGEWLAVLRDAGITAFGVDTNRVSVERCIAQGLRAELSDAIDYLARQADASANLVSAFHLVEHLPVETVISMLIEARRVLVPGGLLILETPNPGNLAVGANAFRLDPTHRDPIPTPLLRLIVEFAKFEVIDTLALQPDDTLRGIAVAERWPETLTQLFAGPRDTGLVARVPRAALADAA